MVRLVTIKTGQIGVLSLFGRFNRLLTPGLHVTWPFVTSVHRVSTLERNHEGSLSFNTCDNVDTTLAYRFTTTVSPADAANSLFVADDPVEYAKGLITSALRQHCALMGLSELNGGTLSVETKVLGQCTKPLSEKGLTLRAMHIVSVSPNREVQKAMNAVLVSKRNREAHVQDAQGKREVQILGAQADKERQILKAEGTKECMRLEGEGFAQKRRAMVNGYTDSVEDACKKLGITPAELMHYLNEDKYTGVLQALAESNNKSWVVYASREQRAERGNMLVSDFMSRSMAQSEDEAAMVIAKTEE